MAQKVLYNNFGRVTEITLSSSSVDLGNVTNDAQIAKSIVDAKGDLITATADNTPVRQAPGNDGQVLIADSALTNGLGWKDLLKNNWVTNGNFDVAQRGTSFTNPAAGAYLLDRYKCYYNADGGRFPTIVVSQSAITPGDVEKSFNCLKVNVNGAGSSLGNSSYYWIYQYIEHGTRFLCGANKKVTISFYAKSSIANKKLGIYLAQYYGTGDSPSVAGHKSGTHWALTSFWTKYTHTFTMDTLESKTFGTNNDDAIILYFVYQWGSNIEGYVGDDEAETFVGSGDIEITQVQLVAGDVAIPFEPRILEEELRLCQRYYEKSYEYGTAVGSATSTGMSIFLPAGGACVVGSYVMLATPYKVVKRIAGTPVIYDAAGTSSKVTLIHHNKTTTNNVAGTVSGQTTKNFNVYAATTATTHRGMEYHWYCDSEF